MIGLGIAAFTFVLRIPTLAEPRWYHDESVFTTVAWTMSKGVTLYAGIYDLQPPAIYWLYWVLLVPLGGIEHHIVIQLAASAFVMATAVLTYEIARRFIALWPACLAGLLIGFAWAIPTLDGDLLNVELAALPFFLSGLLLAFSPRSILLLASGALVGIALVFRPSFAVDTLALLVPLLSTGRRELRLVLFGLGLAAVLGAVVLGLWLESSLSAFVNIVMPSDRRYLIKNNGGTFIPVFVRLVVLGVIGLVFFLRAKTTWDRMLSVWLPASLMGSSLTPIDYTHFAHEALPPIAIGIVMIATRYPFNWRSLAWSGIALILCVEAVLIVPDELTAFTLGRGAPRIYQHNFGFEALPFYYANWLAFAIGVRSQRDYEEWFPGVAERDSEIAGLQRAGVSRSDTLLVLGSTPWLYFESGLLPSTPWITTSVADWQVPAAGHQIHSNLRDGCSGVVIAIQHLDYWQGDLQDGGYVPVDGTPWPTFRSDRAQPCPAPSGYARISGIQLKEKLG